MMADLHEYYVLFVRTNLTVSYGLSGCRATVGAWHGEIADEIVSGALTHFDTGEATVDPLLQRIQYFQPPHVCSAAIGEKRSANRTEVSL
jgi:hypothetical protein